MTITAERDEVADFVGREYSNKRDFCQAGLGYRQH